MTPRHLLLILSILFLCLPLAPAQETGFTLRGPRSGDTITVRPTPGFANHHYSITVVDGTDAIQQTFTIRNGISLDPEDVIVEDLNADGFRDLRLRGGSDALGDPWFKTWVWRPDKAAFSWIDEPR